MTINLKIPNPGDLKPRITVVGVGGAGGNGVNNMIESGLEGVEFIVANTDAQALAQSSAERRIQIGSTLTEGLGAGSQPQIGAAAAEEALPEISDHLSGSHMVFITAGMGGGTGTGAAPVFARAARELGILTVAVVTKPFQFEGQRRMDIADAGIEDLAHYVDTLIVIPNQNLFRVANENTTFADAFAMADQVLYAGVAGITDLMVKEGLINLDFADVRSIINEMGKAMMGTGEATGENRAIEAAEAAISNPLLDDVDMNGARGLLISITGGKDLKLYEVDEAATRIREEADPEANIILGATFDDALEGTMRVSVVATGIEVKSAGTGTARPDQQEGDLPDGALAAGGQGAPDDAPRDEPAPDFLVSAAQPAYGHDMDTNPPAGEAGGAYETADPSAQAGDGPRPAAPRMPSVEDFPPHVQNEVQSVVSGAVEAMPEMARKKTGFFERLASVGLGRKEAIARPAGPPEPMLEPVDGPAPQQPLPAAVLAPGESHEPVGEQAAEGQGPAFLQSMDRCAGEVEDDELEIPAFLRRQAN